MATRAQYQTRQITELQNYLKTIKGSHVTVSDIDAYFKKQGITVGLTTIYRHLDKMVREGTVAKYNLAEGESACYEYIGEESGKHEPTCFHCKCEKCGTLIHLHCQELTGIGMHLESDHGFRLNPLRTVFYGLCENCSKPEN